MVWQDVGLKSAFCNDVKLRMKERVLKKGFCNFLKFTFLLFGGDKGNEKKKVEVY